MKFRFLTCLKPSNFVSKIPYSTMLNSIGYFLRCLKIFIQHFFSLVKFLNVTDLTCEMLTFLQVIVLVNFHDLPSMDVLHNTHPCTHQSLSWHSPQSFSTFLLKLAKLLFLLHRRKSSLILLHFFLFVLSTSFRLLQSSESLLASMVPNIQLWIVPVATRLFQFV